VAGTPYPSSKAAGVVPKGVPAAAAAAAGQNDKQQQQQGVQNPLAKQRKGI
jgi:hypothetical protein